LATGSKLLSKKRGAGMNPYAMKCELCKQRLHDGGQYCQECAYSKGICRLCGKVVLKGREFYKSFYSEENQKKFAPKRDAGDALPEQEGAAEEGAEGEKVEKPKKKVKKVKKVAGGSDDAKRQAEKSVEVMKDFVKDDATGYYYNANTRQYYDPNSQLYYTFNNGAWYYYDQTKGEYVACATAAADNARPLPEPEPVKITSAYEAASEICANAGEGSMPLEVAQARAKPAMTGLRG